MKTKITTIRSENRLTTKHNSSKYFCVLILFLIPLYGCNFIDYKPAKRLKTNGNIFSQNKTSNLVMQEFPNMGLSMLVPKQQHNDIHDGTDRIIVLFIPLIKYPRTGHDYGVRMRIYKKERKRFDCEPQDARWDNWENIFYPTLVEKHTEYSPDLIFMRRDIPMRDTGIVFCVMARIDETSLTEYEIEQVRNMIRSIEALDPN